MYSDTAHIGLLGPVLGFILLYTLFIYFFSLSPPRPLCRPIRGFNNFISFVRLHTVAVCHFPSVWLCARVYA